MFDDAEYVEIYIKLNEIIRQNEILNLVKG